MMTFKQSISSYILPVTNIFEQYILIFLHPIDYHKKLTTSRLERSKVASNAHKKGENVLYFPFDSLITPKVNDASIDSDSEVKIGINFTNALAISWVMRFVKALYSIAFIYLGLMAYQYYFAPYGMTNIGINLENNFQLKFKALMVLSILLEVVMFPIWTWFVAKIWILVMSFFGNLFEVEGPSEEMAYEIVSGALCTHLLYIVPIFGDALQQLLAWFYLYIGLKKNMQLSNMESAIVLMIPAITILFSFLLIFIWGLFMIRLILN